MTSFLSSIGKKKRSPEQLVQAVKDSLQRLTGSSFASISNPADTENEKKLEEERNALLTTIGKALVDMKNILYGDHDSSAVPSSSNSGGTSTSLPLEEEKIRELSLQLQSDDALVNLIRSLAQISFESRKDTTQIFCHLLKKNIASFAQNLIQHHLSLIHFLIEGYGNAEIAFHCGIMIREAIKYADILRYILLTHPQHLVWPFIDRFLHLPNFDIASDGFNTFKEFFGASVSSSGPSGVGGSGLTPEQVSQHKQIINDFFDQHGTDFLSKYEILLRSENYVTRRRSLKLLGELLLDRSHYSLMIRYVSSPTNLKTIMHLLRNRSPHITFETFHIFKIFVANPNKPPEIASILFNNKVKLIAYLENFQNDRTDVQFIEEKRLLIETLQQLADPYEHMEGGGRAEERGLFSRASSKREEMAPGNIVGDVERLSLTDSNHGERSSSVGDNSSNTTTRQINPTDLISPPSQI